MSARRSGASAHIILPGRLVWAPEAAPGSADASVPALSLCLHGVKDGSRPDEYSVCHYDARSLGRAFGPLSLEALLRFCRGLEVALTSRSEADGPLVLTTPVGDAENRANAAVLLGSYLLLRERWTVHRVAYACPKDSCAKFACAWAGAEAANGQRELCVRDCWLGVEMARAQGWIDAGFIWDEQSMEEACTAYNHPVSRYDAAWIIPGKLMVAADPTTVVYDPNPATFTQIFPEADQCSTSAGSPREDSPASFLASANVSDTASVNSTETVCKEYGAWTAVPGLKDVSAKDDQRDWVTFVQDSGIGMVVRANYNEESGMPSSSYGDHALELFGIGQANLRVVDKKGGLPRPSDIRSMLDTCDDFLEGEGRGVLVHCKGGFGRSVVLASCLAMSRFDVSGRALLGWVRIVRPGAITCPHQEAFLKSLGGRVDVMRHCGKPCRADGSVNVSCGAPCCVQ